MKKLLLTVILIGSGLIIWKRKDKTIPGLFFLRKALTLFLMRTIHRLKREGIHELYKWLGTSDQSN